ncbi:MAG: hypothetical protein ACRDS1_10745 [Pseudonocardiaceae bacterium]
MNPRLEYVQLKGHAVRVLRVPPTVGGTALVALLREAGLPIGVPVVVLVGGAGGLEPADTAACADLFASALVPLIESAGAVLVDGGTDAGIMRLAGRAAQRAEASFPRVGVVSEGTVRWPGQPPAREDAADLEPHHTHVVAVPGDEWGDEAPWLSAVAGALAGPAPSVTVLANGGAIAYQDVRHSLAAGRPVLVLSGTGRVAEDISTARAGRPGDPRAAEAAASALLTTVPHDPRAVRAALAAALDV